MHRAGVVDKFVPNSVLFDSILPVLFTQFTAFSTNFAASPRSKFGRFDVFFLAYTSINFFSVIKRVQYAV